MVGSPWMMHFLGLFDKTISETVEMMYEWTSPYAIDTSKAEKAFGWTATPLVTAIHQTLLWCKHLTTNQGLQK